MFSSLKNRIKRDLYIEKYRKKISNGYQQLPNKVPLTKTQQKEIQQYWKGLLGYEIPLDWHQYFSARTGLFSTKYVPTGIYRLEVVGRLNKLSFCFPYSDKNMLDVLFPTINQSHIYLKNRNGYYFIEGKPVSKNEAIECCANLGDVVIKPTLTSHGDGVAKIHVENGEVDGDSKLDSLFANYDHDFLIEDLVKQHPAMSALNPDSVNTIRAVTYRTGMDVVVLYTAIRIGRKGRVIDNESAGGMSAKINPDGTLAKYAFGAPGQDFIEQTDTGVKLEGYKVPSYDKVLAFVKELHLNLPFHMIVGWDVCIDEKGEPLLLEWNSSPELSQSAVGPAFGDYTEQIVKEAMTKPCQRRLDPINLGISMKWFFNKYL
ncbi:MAG: hypothetical protein IJK84_00580 [Bacteroidales bacterium]|nr:hypothetical protein [Bacteroidales bacterium]